MKIAQAAADEAGEGAVPEPVEVDYYDNLPGDNADEKKFRTCHAKTFAYIRRRCHLLSSRRLSDIKPTCRAYFGC